MEKALKNRDKADAPNQNPKDRGEHASSGFRNSDREIEAAKKIHEKEESAPE